MSLIHMVHIVHGIRKFDNLVHRGIQLLKQLPREFLSDRQSLTEREP